MKIRKALRRACLVLLAVLVVFAGLIRPDLWTVNAAEGTVGELTWSLTADGTLTVSGNGAIPDYSDSTHAPWYEHKEQIRVLVMEAGISKIGNYAFLDHGNLEAVTIPDTVTAIGKRAFYGCASLEAAAIPDSVTSLGEGTFWGCTSLAEVTISNSISNLESSAFNRCSSLTAVTIPVGVTRIGGSTFYGCTGLTEITIPFTVAKIEKHAFRACDNLNTVVFVGDAPQMDTEIFSGVQATAYYPDGNGSWTEEVRRGYGGLITWVMGQPDQPAEPEQPEQPDPLRGDMNGDGVVTSDDAIYLLYHVLFPEQYPLS